MKVSCIIPFWNEANRIGKVLTALEKVSLVDEILLVDDGSTDGGINVPADSRITLHRFETNRGKSAAMRFGFSLASGEVILFLDADLNGLTGSDITSLLTPILQKECVYTMALREYFLFFDVVSGERAMLKRDWESFFKAEKFNRNAMEIGMNRYLLLNNLKMKTVSWSSVRQTYKTAKIGFFQGMNKDVSYVIDWMRQMGVFSFSCTYLLYWLLIIQGETQLIRKGKQLYRRIFQKEFAHLLIQ